MKTIELNLKSVVLGKMRTLIESIHVTEDGCWFYFDSDGPDMMKLVVPPDESNYTYSHGGKLFREAIDVIHEWKESTGFGFEQ